MGTYEVEAVRQDCMVYINVYWPNGYVQEAGHILLGWDGLDCQHFFRQLF